MLIEAVRRQFGDVLQKRVIVTLTLYVNEEYVVVQIIFA